MNHQVQYDDDDDIKKPRVLPQRFYLAQFYCIVFYQKQTLEEVEATTMSEPMERIRNIWISGLLDPSKVRVTERYWFYTGDLEKMEEARKEVLKNEKYYESFVKEESWLSNRRSLKKGDSHSHCKWMCNPTSHSIPADVTFFNWRKHYKVLWTRGNSKNSYLLLIFFKKMCMSLQMSVIDTPDCVDFTPEVENALRAFDGAVLVLPAVGGVLDQSIFVDNKMVTYQLPKLVFINNLDQNGANPWEVVNQVNFFRELQ